jgi:diguanylate cyclase (GGDEF)-like protein
MMDHLQSLRNLPISRLIMASIVLVSLLPLVLLSPQIHQTIWDNAQREVTEKHLLIAQNLAEPLRLFVDSHQNSLQMLANTFQQFGNSPDKLKVLLDQSLNQAQNFTALTLINIKGQLLISSIKNNTQGNNFPDYSKHPCFLNILKSGKKEVSATHFSRITSKPTIMMGQPVFNLKNELVSVLLAEIDLTPIEAIRAKIRFGQLGHGAIVDAKGQTLAHPNPEWTANIKDLSHWPIVKKMMAGETGVMEFYSSHIKSDMIAGYAGIKGLDWGVMVPQPKYEIEASVATILNSLMLWSILGIVIAVIAAYFLSLWISRPINLLARKAKQINHHEEALDLKSVVESAPCEIVEMANAMQTLMIGLQASNQEFTILNDSLQNEIKQATSDLQAANDNLQQIASSDHLTTIANRRFFENTVTDILGDKTSRSIGIMLVDIDNFKDINDQHGHAAGDYILTTVAELLTKATRPGDIIARYGGDEFVAEFESDVVTIQKRAEELRHTVENYPFIWHDKALKITLSIGIICHKTNESSSLDKLMSIADTAMYQAKKSGRNKVALLSS